MKFQSHVAFCLLLVLTFASSFALAASVKEPAVAKIFLLAGQSNMNGYGSVSELQPPYNKDLPAVKIWHGLTREWTDLGPRGQSFGPELSFGRAIAESLEGDIRLVKYAANGTALYDDWEPPSGPQYVEFRRTVKEALSDLDASNIEYEIAGMLWLQGESDAKEGHGQEYEKNLKAFIDYVRRDISVPSMKFIIARVRTYYGEGVQADMVRSAQQTVAKEVDNVTWFDTDDCGALIRGGHYASQGLIEIGNRFALSYTDMVTTLDN